MKYLLCLLLFSGAAFADKKFDVIDEIRTLDFAGDTFTVTFWGNNRIFKVPRNHRTTACLENAYKAHMKVALNVNTAEGQVLDCKLFSGPMPAR